MNSKPKYEYGYLITSKVKKSERELIERIAQREQRPISTVFRMLALQAAAEYESAPPPLAFKSVSAAQSA